MHCGWIISDLELTLHVLDDVGEITMSHESGQKFIDDIFVSELFTLDVNDAKGTKSQIISLAFRVDATDSRL